MQTFDLTTCNYFFIGFIDFMIKIKCLLTSTNLFSTNEYEEKK